MEKAFETVELKVPEMVWHSRGDEECFFQWLYSIKGYVTCVGKGTILYITIRISEIDRESAQDLVGLFKRYNVSDMHQLAFIKHTRVGKWFFDSEKYWHNDIFGL